jgi:predicted RNA-binding protein with PIN domain
MPIHLLIDGYNLLKRMGLDVGDLETARRALLDRLAGYKRERGARITVVFDAYRSFSLNRTRENHKGVDVVFSRENETADDVIRERIRTRQTGLVVVSSDRAIIDEAKGHGVAFLTADRLESMICAPESVIEERPRPEKRGNPRKLPKSLRRAKRTIGKI